jgi:hypothetical protein
MVGKMKRAPSEDLFRLIRSLSKGEKRNFKLLAGLLASEKDKKYVELFDVIDKQDVYDEGKVIKLLKHLYGGQLAVGKHYLFKLILNSLVYYNNSPGSDLNNLVEQIKILVGKDLYPQASKLIRKGLLEAIEIEDFATQYALLGQQLELLLRVQNVKGLMARIAEIEQERTRVIGLMINFDRYKSLNNRAFGLIQSRQVASGVVDQASLAALKQDVYVTHPEQAQSTRARIEYLALQRKLCSFGNDLEGAIDFSTQLLAVFDSSPRMKEEAICDYFSELGNVCTYLMRLGRVQEAFSKMEQIRQFKHHSPKSRLDFFQLYYVMVAAAAVHVGEPERAVAIEADIEAEWATLEGKVPKAHEMWLSYLLAYSHFMLGKPKLALRWVRKLLAEPKSEVRLDIQCNAKLLNLMIHYELGNFILIESEIVSARRFLEKHDQYHDFEKQVLKAVKALTVSANSPNAQQVKENWRLRLLQYEKSPLKNVPRMIDIADWLQSNLEGCTMAALRKAKIEPGDFSNFRF